MRAIIFGVVTAVTVAAIPAFSQADDLTSHQKRWVFEVQTCLKKKNVPYTRSGCEIHPGLKLWCSGKHRDAGIACLAEVGSQTSKKAIPLMTDSESKDKDD